MDFSEKHTDGDVLAHANSVRYKVELVLIKLRLQVGLSFFALMVSLCFFLLLLNELLLSNSSFGTYESFVPGIILLTGFVFIQSFRCFKMSIYLYLSTTLSKRRIVSSIEDWSALRGTEHGYE